jgi:hypothetical protein
MRIKGAMTILNKRAEFYGKTVGWLVDDMDRCLKETGYIDESKNVTEAYKVYKFAERMNLSGVNRYVKKEIA